MSDKGSHYDVLELEVGATEDAIRKAYRRLAMKYHPDKSDLPDAADRFVRVNEAYAALTDPDRRASYDRLIEMKRREAEAAKNPRRQAPKPNTQPFEPVQVTVQKRKASADEIVKLTGLLTRGRIADAERSARRLISSGTRHPIPYAIMGDIARMRGEYTYSAEMYAYAAQMEPTNEVYQRKHEEVLRSVNRPGPKHRVAAQEEVNPTGALMTIGLVTLLGAGYVALSIEKPATLGLEIVNTWTAGLIAMLFLLGCVVGGALGAARLLERFTTAFGTNSVAPISPAVVLGLLAGVNFWLAAAIYVAVGMTQNAFNPATSRLMSAVAAVTTLMGLASWTGGKISPLQVVAWGGNVIYVVALLGWLVADLYLEDKGI